MPLKSSPKSRTTALPTTRKTHYVAHPKHNTSCLYGNCFLAFDSPVTNISPRHYLYFSLTQFKKKKINMSVKVTLIASVPLYPLLSVHLWKTPSYLNCRVSLCLYLFACEQCKFSKLLCPLFFWQTSHRIQSLDQSDLIPWGRL